MKAIESFSLTKNYHGSKTPALSNITLTVPSGQVFTLLGRNGAGKTTFLRIAATQLLPTEGKLHVLGRDAITEPTKIRGRVAVVPQEGNTIGPLTPWDHVYLTLLARGMSRSEARRRAREALERMELTPYRDKTSDTLSGGLRQRVRVAMAVATDAELLFLDEPTLGLDALTRRHIWTVLREICREGRTILLTTHYVDDAEILSNNVMVIHEGQLKAIGSPTQLLATLKERVRVDVVGGGISEEALVRYGRVVRLAERWRVLTNESEAAELAAEAVRRGSQVSVGPVSLEDLFVDVVGREENV